MDSVLLSAGTEDSTRGGSHRKGGGSHRNRRRKPTGNGGGTAISLPHRRLRGLGPLLITLARNNFNLSHFPCTRKPKLILSPKLMWMQKILFIRYLSTPPYPLTPRLNRGSGPRWRFPSREARYYLEKPQDSFTKQNSCPHYQKIPLRRSLMLNWFQTLRQT